MSECRPAGQLDVIEALRSERGAFVGLLESLEAGEWSAPTECPEWSVKGVALHVLGDDLSLLSRQRDAATNSLQLMAAEEPNWEFRRLLDGFNERWVHRASFMSPRLVIEMLNVTGDLTADFYAGVDPHRLGESVQFVGPGPAPYWMIAAREYAERWIHHLQVARATSRPGPVEVRFVSSAVAALMRGFPSAMSLLPAQSGSRVSFLLDGSGKAWTLINDEGRWSLHDGAHGDPTVRVSVPVDIAAGLFSRGLGRREILSGVAASGDQDLAKAVTEGLAAFFARD